MYLKTLTLRGFKSFASATRLELEPGITCVVGPNGSGKSNVVDALAWVMGEQGAKSLRGGKMEDVIFAGTSKRQALGRAEVSLTIDNTDGAIPIDYTEVTISRTLFRSGGSEYAVNGAPARLLDIQELLSDSGLGREMHVIVGQGRLDHVLQADPFERRGVIEEAAGVLKHRRRREKAVRKLTGLQNNLDRLKDLRAELGRQLGPLGRQARAAQRAASVQAALRDASARLLADDIVQAQAGLEHMGDAAAYTAEKEQLTHLIADAEARIEQTLKQAGRQAAVADELSAQLRRIGQLAVRAHAAVGRARDRAEYLRAAAPAPTGDAPEALLSRAERYRGELADAEEQQARRAQKLDELGTSRTELAAELEQAEAALKTARAEIAERVRTRAGAESAVEVAEGKLAAAEREAHALGPALEELRARLGEAEAALKAAQHSAASRESGEDALDAAHEAASEQLRSAQQAHDDLRQRTEELRAELRRTEARIEALHLSTKLSVAAEDLLALKIPGLKAQVSDLLHIEAGCETAIAAALGPFAQAMFADAPEAGLALLEQTEDSVEVDAVIGAPPTSSAPAAPPRGTRAALSAVSTDDAGLAATLRAALASTVIVADIAEARRTLAQHPELTCVTETGTVLEAHRIRRAGRAEASRAAARNALAHAQQQAASLAEQIAAAELELARAREALSTASAAEQAALAALHESDTAILAAQGEVSAAAGTCAEIRAEIERTQQRSAKLAERTREAQDELSRARAALAGLDEAPAEEPDSTERDALAARHSELGEEVMEARIAVRSADDRVRFLTDRIDALRRQAAEQQALRERLAREAEARAALAERAAEAGDTAEALTAVLREREAAAEQRLRELTAERQRAAEAEAGMREECDALRERLAALAEDEHAAALKRERFVLRLEELTRRAELEIGLSPENLVNQFGPHLEVPDFTADAEDGDYPTSPYVRADVEAVKARAEREMKRIGTVNPLALEEYRALQERHDYLEKQITDIEKTREDLLGLVADIDDLVKEVFAEAFADTAREFEAIFARLFPGGEGSLALTDPDDMLTTGVEVFARPAGKRVRRLSLLSGGERSLVAIAILVAIFKARPSPFYVMDEVEAALDDVNLTRLLGVFAELQESSQLIVITHQKRTMEIADALYGVTMGGDGISKVVSQRLSRHADEHG